MKHGAHVKMRSVKARSWSTRWKVKHHTSQILILVTERLVDVEVTGQLKDA